MIEEEMNFRDWRKLAVFVSGESAVSFLARPGYSVELGSTHPCHSWLGLECIHNFYRCDLDLADITAKCCLSNGVCEAVSLATI